MALEQGAQQACSSRRSAPAGMRKGDLFCFIWGSYLSEGGNPRRVSGCFFQKCPILAGSRVTFSKSAQSSPGLGLLFPKVPNPRRVSGYFFQSDPILAGSRATFSKVTQSSPGLGLLFPKVPNPRRVSGCFFQKCPIRGRVSGYFFQSDPILAGSRATFSKSAQSSPGFGLLFPK